MIQIYDTNGLVKQYEGNILTEEILQLLNINTDYKYLISSFDYFPPPNMIFENGNLSYRSKEELIQLGFVNPQQNPYPDLPYWIFNEKNNKWEIDIIKFEKYKLENKQTIIKQLLLESDYIELPSFLERKGQEIYNTWMTYRENLRLAYHDSSLPLPEAPQ